MRLPTIILSAWLIAGGIIPEANAQSEDSSHDRITHVFLEDLQDGDILAAMQAMVQRLVENTREWSRIVRETITEREAKAVARALLLPVLILETGFCGLRIIARHRLSEQLARLTTMTFIAVLVLTGVPQKILIGVTDYLSDAGRNIGVLILRATAHHTGTTSSPEFQSIYHEPLLEFDKSQRSKPVFEPVFYWCAWLGSPPGRTELLDNNHSPHFKFAPSSLLRRIWNQQSSPFSQEADTPKETEFAVGLLDYLQRSGQVFLQTFFLLGLFLLCLSIAAVQLGAYAVILFAALSILLGAFVSFDLIVAIGYATLPLIYFPAFDRIWAQYLVALVALTLVPFFYYLCSAIGFAFSTSIFEVLFPLEPSTATFAQVLSSVYLGTVYVLVDSLHGLLPQLWGTMEDQGATMIEGLVYLGKILAGSLIVSACVSIGVGFAALAPVLAMRWHCGFSGEGVFDRIAGGIGQMRSALIGGIGGLYRGAFEHGSRWMGRQKPPGT